MDWIKIWTFFFFLSLALFVCLSIVVTIGGFFDIRSLLKDLSEARQKAERSPADDDGQNR